MNREVFRRSQATVWVVVLLVAPLLYLITAPAVYMVGIGGPEVFVAHVDVTEPPWLRRYYYPYGWLNYNTRLKRPLTANEVLWARLARSWVGASRGSSASPTPPPTPPPVSAPVPVPAPDPLGPPPPPPF